MASAAAAASLVQIASASGSSTHSTQSLMPSSCGPWQWLSRGVVRAEHSRFMPCSAPAPNGGLGAVGSDNPRSLITWDSFNSTDFNALKSAVGLANVSAAFAWQSPPALAAHSTAPGGDSAFAAAAPFLPGAAAAAPGPAAVPMNGVPGGRGATDATGATAGMHGSGSSSPYGGSLAAGLAAGMPPLLGDALPPLAAPPGLATSFQQVTAVLLSQMCC